MARAHWVEVDADFTAPPERVFDHLSEHENLAAVFGAKITRLADGTDGHRNGVGSRRRLVVGPGVPPFEETVTAFEPYSLIEYRITEGSPMKDHVGIMRFSPNPDGGTHLNYRIRLQSSIPGLALIVKTQLTGSVTKGMKAVDAAA
jgi:uncharacterized protein YndB with AHSA1/START domain